MVTSQECKVVSTLERAWQLAGSVPDPELPMLTVADLGILREISLDGDKVVVSLTPTYSGCPATAQIRFDVCERLAEGGFADVQVRTVLDPPWSSDWITPDGRRKLSGAGLAPPRSLPHADNGPVPLTLSDRGALLRCPACGSADTRRTAAFGATACKDLWRCLACGEPFEHVREI
jgi:ring-1,2-phenylacetyl-CoA epoxidase subunit PaaD